MVFGTHRVQGVPDAQGQAGAQGPLGPQGTPGKKASKVDNGDSATTSVRAVQTDGSTGVKHCYPYFVQAGGAGWIKMRNVSPVGL